MSEDHPDVGETWYARIGYGVNVREVTVTDLTVKTVEVRELGDLDGRPHTRRYERCQIRFIERKSAAPVAPADVIGRQ